MLAPEGHIVRMSDATSCCGRGRWQNLFTSIYIYIIIVVIVIIIVVVVVVIVVVVVVVVIVISNNSDNSTNSRSASLMLLQITCTVSYEDPSVGGFPKLAEEWSCGPLRSKRALTGWVPLLPLLYYPSRFPLHSWPALDNLNNTEGERV